MNLYHTANLPTFTWYGALKPQRDNGKIMRTVALAFCIAMLLAAGIL